MNPADRPATEPRPFCIDCGHWKHDPGSCDGLGHIFTEFGVPVVTDCTCEVHDDERAAQGAAPLDRDTKEHGQNIQTAIEKGVLRYGESDLAYVGLSEGAAPRAEGLLDPKFLRLALLDLAGMDYAYDARLDSGDYGLLERPYELADRIFEAYRAVVSRPSNERVPESEPDDESQLDENGRLGVYP